MLCINMSEHWTTLVHVVKEKSGVCVNLRFFQLGKALGNDGIQIEFDKISWPSIGEFMITSINDTFDSKEMYSSQ